MNVEVLKQAERRFLKKYPEGFLHPEMAALGKKHKMPQLVEFAQQSFAKDCFDSPADIIGDMARLVSRSTLVSMFEKPKFKTMIGSLGAKDKTTIVEGLYDLLHGKQRAGFEVLVDELGKRKMAKWTLCTVFQAYYRPQKEVFIKPTTAKLIVQSLDANLTYHSTPTWEFYRDFRKLVKEAKAKVNKNLAPNNPAFCGFLMMTLGDQ